MPNDPIFRTIIVCLGVTVIAGAFLALTGEHYFQDEGLKDLGVGIVLVAGACYLFFRIMGVRRARRAAREAKAEDNSPSESDEGRGQ